MTEHLRKELCDYQRAMVHTYDRLCRPSEHQRKHDDTVYYNASKEPSAEHKATVQFCARLESSVDNLRKDTECCTRLPNRVSSSMDLRDYLSGRNMQDTACVWPGMLPRGD